MRSSGRSKITNNGESSEGRGEQPRPSALPESEIETKAHPQHRKLYGRRKGPKLSAYQQSLVDTLLPHLLIAPEQGRDARSYFSQAVQKEISPPPCGEVDPAKRSEAGSGGGSSHVEHSPHPKSLASLDTSTSPQGGGGTGGQFAEASVVVDDVWLEVGFGGGEHLAWQAQHNPRTGMIGCEPYISGVAKLLTKIVDANIPNIRLYTEDAREVIAALPDASLGRAFVLFPDPWPKTRHHKRRFIQTEMLDEFARVLRAGAELRFATDDPSYRVWALERLMAHKKFRWLAEAPEDWRSRPGDWPQTRYEAKALHGVPSFFRFARAA
jgi:tRNA (guanine-N7-)-methyltransferase